MNNEKPEFLTEADLAERWGISPGTVAKMRKAGTGPKTFGVDSRPRYLLSAVEEFEDGGLITKFQLADRWQMSVSGLEKKSAAGLVPGIVKLSGLVRYRLNQIIAFEQGQKAQQQTEERKPQ